MRIRHAGNYQQDAILNGRNTATVTTAMR